MSDHPFATDVYQGSLGKEVELFMLDYSTITGNVAHVAYFCSSAQSTVAVKWKNKAGTGWVDYVPLPIVAEGFEAKSDGTLPRPKLSVSNVEATLGAMAGPLFTLVYTYQDLLGAKLTRYKTLDKYLYGGASQNYNAHFPEDVYVLNQKMNHNALLIEWQLAPDFDVQGIMLPRRLILRDMCQLRYRIWNPTTQIFDFDDTENACPIINRVILVADGTFATVSGWGTHPYWNWDSENHLMGHATGHTNILEGTTFITAGHRYVITLHVDVDGGGSTLTGSCVVKLGGTDFHTIDDADVGDLEFWVTAGAANSPITFDPSSDFNGIISDVAMDQWLDEHEVDAGAASSDKCSHTLAGCQKRWPSQALPFSGFPGVGRVRV